MLLLLVVSLLYAWFFIVYFCNTDPNTLHRLSLGIIFNRTRNFDIICKCEIGQIAQEAYGIFLYAQLRVYVLNYFAKVMIKWFLYLFNWPWRSYYLTKGKKKNAFNLWKNQSLLLRFSLLHQSITHAAWLHQPPPVKLCHMLRPRLVPSLTIWLSGVHGAHRHQLEKGYLVLLLPCFFGVFLAP